MASDRIPSASALAWPTLVAIRDVGGAADIRTIAEKVADSLDLSTEARSIRLSGGARTLLDYRLAWARTLLKGVGALTNDSRRQWSITPLGRDLTEPALRRLGGGSKPHGEERPA
jgi:restriction system protein